MLNKMKKGIKEMISKHTPAPWHRNIPSKDARYPTIYAGRNTHIAVASGHGQLSNEEIEANISLIAAAPELLEACRQIIWKLSHGTNENPNTISRLDATVKMAIAAIKKAERL